MKQIEQSQILKRFIAVLTLQLTIIYIEGVSSPILKFTHKYKKNQYQGQCDNITDFLY